MGVSVRDVGALQWLEEVVFRFDVWLSALLCDRAIHTLADVTTASVRGDEKSIAMIIIEL